MQDQSVLACFVESVDGLWLLQRLQTNEILIIASRRTSNILALCQVHARDESRGYITIATRTAHLELTGTLTRVGAIDIEFDNRVELVRLLEQFQPVLPFPFLRHEAQVLVVRHNLICSFILSSISCCRLAHILVHNDHRRLPDLLWK